MTVNEQPELLINLAPKLSIEPHKPFWEVIPMKKVKTVKAIKPKEIKRTLNRIDQFVEYSFVKKVGDAVVSSKQDRDLALLLQINQRSPVYKDTVRVRFRRSEYLSTLYTIDNAIDMCREGKYDGMEIVQIDTAEIKKAKKVSNTIAWITIALAVSVAINAVFITVLCTISLLK